MGKTHPNTGGTIPWAGTPLSKRTEHTHSSLCVRTVDAELLDPKAAPPW